MKSVVVSLAVLFGVSSAILIKRNEDLNKRFHIQDDHGNFKFGYNVNEVNAALHDRHPVRGALDKAYSNGRFQYGAIIKGIPFSNRWRYGHLPAPLPAPIKTDGEVNWVLSSTHQAHRILPEYHHSFPYPLRSHKYILEPRAYPYHH